jgi:hypothetical protein
MKHWGIWIIKRKAWFILESGEIFSTTSIAIARLQMEHSIGSKQYADKAEVREFPES